MRGCAYPCNTAWHLPPCFLVTTRGPYPRTRTAPQTYALPWFQLSVCWMSCEISCVCSLLIIKSDTDGDASNVLLKSQHVTENEVIVLGGGTCSFRCLFNIQCSCSVRAGTRFQMLLGGCASLHIFFLFFLFWAWQMVICRLKVISLLSQRPCCQWFLQELHLLKQDSCVAEVSETDGEL